MENEIEIPSNQADLQDFLADLWETIFKEDKPQLIRQYNEAARKYNAAAKFQAITLIFDFKKQQKMAKDAAAQGATEVKKVVAKKSKADKQAELAAKAEAPKVEKPAKEVKEKLESQKEFVARMADQGKNVKEIVEASTDTANFRQPISQTNVAWYYSRLGYGAKAKKAKEEAPAATKPAASE